MVLKYHISPFPTLEENMVVKIYEAQGEALVYEEVLEAPHDSPRTIIVNGLDRVVHIVRLYSAVTVAKLHDYNAEPINETVTAFNPIRFRIGDAGELTPASGADTYTNIILKGLLDDEYVVYRNGYGVLHPNVHYTNNPGDGGFILQEGDVFGDTDEFTIQRKSDSSTQVVNDSVVGKWFSGFVDITGNVSYSLTHLRKLLRLIGDAIFTFPADSSIPVGYTFCFQHFGLTGNAKVKFLNAPLKWKDATKSELTISSLTEAAFAFDGTNWNVVYLCKSDFAESVSTGYVSGQTIAVGKKDVGDVASGDPTFEVIHNKAIAGDYYVFLSIQTDVAANYHRNNRVTFTWWHADSINKPNKFFFSLQELSSETQGITVNWLIIKT